VYSHERGKRENKQTTQKEIKNEETETKEKRGQAKTKGNKPSVMWRGAIKSTLLALHELLLLLLLYCCCVVV